MKKLFLLAFSFSFLFVACSKNDQKMPVLKWVGNDIVRMEMYVGSANGGRVPLWIDTARNVDSIRSLILANQSRFFKGKFKPDYYKGITVEFNGDRLTSTYYNGYDTIITTINGVKITTLEPKLKKIVAQYKFKGDSLFVLKNDDVNNKEFIAQGNKFRLNRMQSLLNYRLPSGKDTTVVFDDRILTQEKALRYSGYNNIGNMGVKDTLLWCNVRFNIR